MTAKAIDRRPLVDHSGIALATDKPNTEPIDPTRINLNGGTQMRAGINPDVVTEYADLIERGIDFPPPVVYYDGADYWCADGFHRISAYLLVYKRLKLSPGRIEFEVRPGTRRDAILYAAAANASHGLRRTNADKRRSVETLLRDEEWRQWSDAEIGRRCLVDPKTVGNIRRELAGNREIPDSTTRKAADGRVINTRNMGTNQPRREPVKVEPKPGKAVYVPSPFWMNTATPDDLTDAGYWLVWREAHGDNPATYKWARKTGPESREYSAPFTSRSECLGDARRMIAARTAQAQAQAQAISAEVPANYQIQAVPGGRYRWTRTINDSTIEHGDACPTVEAAVAAAYAHAARFAKRMRQEVLTEPDLEWPSSEPNAVLWGSLTPPDLAAAGYTILQADGAWGWIRRGSHVVDGYKQFPLNKVVTGTLNARPFPDAATAIAMARRDMIAGVRLGPHASYYVDGVAVMPADLVAAGYVLDDQGVAGKLGWFWRLGDECGPDVGYCGAAIEGARLHYLATRDMASGLPADAAEPEPAPEPTTWGAGAVTLEGDITPASFAAYVDAVTPIDSKLRTQELLSVFQAALDALPTATDVLDTEEYGFDLNAARTALRRIMDGLETPG